jgi:hypothetical protein
MAIHKCVQFVILARWPALLLSLIWRAKFVRCQVVPGLGDKGTRRFLPLNSFGDWSSRAEPAANPDQLDGQTGAESYDLEEFSESARKIAPTQVGVYLVTFMPSAQASL